MKRTVVWLCLFIAACGGGFRDDRPPEVKAAAERQRPTASAPAPSNQERAEYLSRLVLSKVTASRSTSSLQKAMGFIEGEIKNTGEKSLDEVQITVYLMDAHDKPLHEHQCFAVLPKTISGEPTPLKANYARKWNCGAENVPDEWNGSAVQVKVTDVVFSPTPSQ